MRQNITFFLNLRCPINLRLENNFKRTKKNIGIGEYFFYQFFMLCSTVNKFCFNGCNPTITLAKILTC